MNFVDAMKTAYDDPAGSPTPVAVRRPHSQALVFYDRTLFIGKVEFGLRWSIGRSGEPRPYSPDIADVLAEDWEVYGDSI